MSQESDKSHGSDPLIEEIREIRRKISDAHGNDVLRLGKHLQEVQKRYPGRLVRRSPSARSPVKD
jgi:hypothetical protein